MKVYLIHPDPHWDKNKKLKKRTSLFPPLGLLQVAALTPSDIEVKLTDEAVEDIDFDSDADLVGISFNTASAIRAFQVAEEFRKRGKKVVVGGAHPTMMPEECAQYADSVVIGEAECSWHRVLQDFKKGKLEKFYRCDGFPSLENLPIPRRDLLDPKKYAVFWTIQTTRGCPFNCDFCSVTRFFGRTYRTRPIREVIKEVESIESKFLIFVDDNILGIPQYARELFKELTPLKKIWLSQGSLNAAKDEELIKLAAKAGCRGLFIGFESVSEECLKEVGKRHNIVEEYRNRIKLLHHYGIAIIGAFIFGFDHDDKDVFKRTVDFVYREKIDMPQFSILTPLPGTALYERWDKEGRIFTKDWAKYTGNHCVYYPKNMTREELEAGLRWAYKEANGFLHLARRSLCFSKRFPISFLLNYYFHRVVKRWLRTT
ncbi:B12-binding domain-containing radical SAM protein [bacterium]|nr:B12-binding domain-containing radical SAM protein [bacterium]